MSIYTNSHKVKNQWISLQLRDIFMSLCCTFSREILSMSSEQIEAIKSKVLVRQARYETLELKSHDESLPELGHIKSHSCPHNNLNTEDQVLKIIKSTLINSLARESIFVASQSIQRILRI